VQQCCVLLIAVVGHCAVNVTDQDCIDYARECVRLAGMAENSSELAADMHEMSEAAPAGGRLKRAKEEMRPQCVPVAHQGIRNKK